VCIALIVSLYALLRSSEVQTFLARSAAHYLSQELNTRVRISGFDITFFLNVTIEGVELADQHQNAILSAGKLKVGLEDIVMGQQFSKIQLTRVSLEDAVFALRTYKGDSTLNLQFIIDHFSRTDTTPKEPGKPMEIFISRVNLNDVRFMMQNQNAIITDTGMDFTNLDISVDRLKITGFSMIGDTLAFHIRELAVREKCGFEIHRLQGEFRFSPAFLIAQQLRAETNNSKLDLDFSFNYDNWNAYVDFLNQVHIKADIRPTRLALHDIAHFAPDIIQMEDIFDFHGSIKGTVSNFKAKDFFVRFGEQTLFKGDVKAYGLPDVMETFVDLKIDSLRTTLADIESFKIPGQPDHIVIPDIFSKSALVSVKGNFTGFYNDFFSDVSIATNVGHAQTRLSVSQQAGVKDIIYKGFISGSAIDLGLLTGQEELLGRATFNGNIDGSGLSASRADLKLNIHIDTININNYNYRDIEIIGSLKEMLFKGDLNVQDRNLQLSFNGNVSLDEHDPYYKFDAEIRKADLHHLHILDRDSISTLSTGISAGFTGLDIDSLEGYIRFDTIRYTEGKQRLFLDHLSMIATSSPKYPRLVKLYSDYLDANFRGNFSFRQFIPSVSDFIRSYLASFKMDRGFQIVDTGLDQYVEYDLRVKNAEPITRLLMPGLSVPRGGEIHGFFDEKRSILAMDGQVPLIRWGDIILDDIRFKQKTFRDSLVLVARCIEASYEQIRETDTLLLALDSLTLSSQLRQDSILFHLFWDSPFHHKSFQSDLMGYISFFDKPKTTIHFDLANVMIDGREWVMKPSNLIILDSSFAKFSDIMLSHGDESLTVNGTISDQREDTLNVLFHRLNVSNADLLLQMENLDINGVLDGELKLNDLYRNPTILADVRLINCVINKEALGDGKLAIEWDNESGAFNILAGVIRHRNIGTNTPFQLSGYYYSKKEKDNLDLTATMSNLSLSFFNPILVGVFDHMKGLASGQFAITGTLEKPEVNGSMHLENAGFRIAYLGVPYQFSDDITIKPDAITFDKILITDSLGNKAELNGKISHQYFSNILFDLKINMNDLAAFNRTAAQNQTFYGKAGASGSVFITGPPDDLSIKVKAMTDKNTSLSIPINTTYDVGQSDYITFVRKDIDTIDRPQAFKSAIKGLSLNFALNVTNDAEVELILPSRIGNITASGTGNLLLSLNPASNFKINGIYRISKGQFFFQLGNLTRKITLRDGGTIQWTGDPVDADILLSGVYRTKASLKGLLPEESQGTSRINVDCIVRLSGKLANPDIHFGIALPNVENDIRQMVFSVVDTTNDNEMTQQFVYLLVMNQFKPVQGVGSVNVDVGATSFGLLTSQVNNLLSKISDNKVDLGVNYKPGSSNSGQELEVALSTQLFNDRLLIDGAFGMNYYHTGSSQKASNIVGDINIEYILTHDRRLRLRAFNRTNDIDLLLNSSQYTQGLGLTYQREFNRWIELFRKPKKRIPLPETKSSNF